MSILGCMTRMHCLQDTAQFDAACDVCREPCQGQGIARNRIH